MANFVPTTCEPPMLVQHLKMFFDVPRWLKCRFLHRILHNEPIYLSYWGIRMSHSYCRTPCLYLHSILYKEPKAHQPFPPPRNQQNRSSVNLADNILFTAKASIFFVHYEVRTRFICCYLWSLFGIIPSYCCSSGRNLWAWVPYLRRSLQQHQ